MKYWWENYVKTLILSRQGGNGVKGNNSKGMFFCSRCGKRSRTEGGVHNHITDLHKNVGEVMALPKRQDLEEIVMAQAQEVARLKTVIEHDRHEVGKLRCHIDGLNDKLFIAEAN